MLTTYTITTYHRLSVEGDMRLLLLNSRLSLRTGASHWSLCEGTLSACCRSPAFRSISSDTSNTPPGPPGRAIFSGIQPSGIPHLGNYLGALQPWVRLQTERKANDVLRFSVVDLHALTVPQEPDRLEQGRWETYIALLAIGLDPKISCIFFQSEVRKFT